MRNNIIRVTVIMAALAAFGCNKRKSDQAVVQEAPASPVIDSAAALPEEPALESVGGKASAPTVEGFSDDGRYVVQIAVYKSRKQSNNLVEKLKEAGYPAYVASVEDPTPDLTGTWYRVRIGNFADAKSARNFGEETLRGQGYDYWVDNKSNDHKAIAASDAGSSYSEPAASSYTEPASSYSPPAEPVSVPEPVPAVPSEPPPAQDAWGTPAPSVPKDTARAVEGW